MMLPGPVPVGAERTGVVVVGTGDPTIEAHQLRTAPLFEVLDHPDFRSCNRYSLSDVSSFLPPADYRRLLAFFARKPGVRFCLRDFLTQRRAPPPEQAGAIRFLTDLQEQLARDDTSLGYTFLIGTTE